VNPVEFIKVRGNELLTGGIGAGLGVLLGEFIGEYVARATNTVGAKKLLAKGLIKGLIGVTLASLSVGVTGPIGFILLVAGYGSIGSIFIDVFRYLVPGGEVGAAEMLARATRAAIGIEKASAVLSRVETAESTGEAPIEMASTTTTVTLA